ncbi:MAG: hypothetical protein IPL26_30145 [Leptospiraceae bacterium]|nr:hypothetical protein [Leptospiraceae bacterium]
MKNILIFLLVLNLSVCEKQKLISDDHSENKITVSIENNEKINLKDFIVNFTITNNTSRDIQVHPDYIKLVSFDSFEKNIHYSRASHEINYTDTGFIKVRAMQKHEFKNRFDFIANDFIEKNKNIKIDGSYFVHFLYVIEKKTYSTGIKQIYLTY